MDLGLTQEFRGKKSEDVYCTSPFPITAMFRGTSMSQKEANLTSPRTWTWSKCGCCFCGLSRVGEAERWLLQVD